MKKIISLITIVLLSFSGLKAQKNLRFEKGVKKVSFDVKSHIVIVKFDEAKTTIRNIQVAITKLGYDADSLLADPKAYEKLNACCKKPK